MNIILMTTESNESDGWKNLEQGDLPPVGNRVPRRLGSPTKTSVEKLVRHLNLSSFEGIETSMPR